MTIGERVKHRRLELGLSAEDVAEALGKNRATVYRYESNDIEKLPTTVLEPLAMVLRTTPAYLMGWTDVPDQTEQKETPSADSERWDRFKAQYDKLPASEQHRIDAVLDAMLADPEAGQDQ